MNRALLLAGIAALLPAAAIAGAAPAGRAGAQTALHFAPGDGQLILTRTLTRELTGGAQIVVTRRFAVRFVAEADGYRLDGRQIDAAVTAPAELAALAQLERTRIETGMFPVRLDRSGALRAVAASGAVSVARARAAALARDSLDKSRLPAADQALARQQVDTLTAAAGSGVMPADLFRPRVGNRTERRTVALPSGEAGLVEVATRVDGVSAQGLARSVRRTVTTTLGGTSRTSREEWRIDAG